VAAKRILFSSAFTLVLAGVVWAAAPRAGVALEATPRARTVTRGQAALYAIVLKRVADYDRTVNIYVSDVPRGVRVSWRVNGPAAGAGSRAEPRVVVNARGIKLVLKPHVVGRATLVLDTSARTELRNFRPLVSARGNGAHAKLRLRLDVRRGAPATPFGLSGTVADPLRPGTSQPLELTISNPFEFALSLTGLDVAVADATSAPGCSGRANYVAEPGRVPYPLVVPPGSSRLSDLAGAAALPRVTMLDLPVNQDACKGARIQLDLSGTAER
jgi:hypothetical protein